MATRRRRQGSGAPRRVYSSRARVRALLSQKEERKKKPPLLFIFLAETSAPVRGGRWGKVGRGWEVGGAAAGEVAGGRGGGGRRRTFRVSGCRDFQWPATVEEGAGGGGGPAAAAVRPAEGAAARESRRPGRAGQPVGGGRRRGRGESCAARQRARLAWRRWRAAAEAPGAAPEPGEAGAAGERRWRRFCDGSSPSRKARQIDVPFHGGIRAR